jgi:prefoldin beta subunit
MELYKVYEAEIKEIERLSQGQSKIRESLQQYEHKKNENEMDKKELTFIEDGDMVYKLIGPILVQQELNEAKLNVENRLGLISKEIAKLEKVYKDNEISIEAKRKRVQQMQNKIIEMSKQIQMQAQEAK